ncbi:MAG: GNAT family N-acetyltransferase [Chloroflexota bacterium]
MLAATDGDTPIAVLIGFIGTDMTHSDRPARDNLLIYSKRMVVHPDYRHLGLGTRLKFAQREHALKQGINRICWTFDPLLSRNAYLNLRKLGAASSSFRENYYGTDNSGGLAPLGYSDRLYIDWWLDDEQVVEIAAGAHTYKTVDDHVAAGTVVLNPTTETPDGLVHPAESLADVASDTPLLVEIPRDFVTIQENHPDLARAWHEHNRTTLGERIAAGYTVIDFVPADYEGRARSFFVLQRASD